MAEPIAYLNGQFVPYSALAIAPHDAGFVWGATITDRVRTFGGQYFNLTDHVHRFHRGCFHARVPLEISLDDLKLASKELLVRNAGSSPSGEWSLVMYATPGPLAHLSPTGQTGCPTLGMYLIPFDPTRFQKLYAEGAYHVAENLHSNFEPQIKHRSRLPWWVTAREYESVFPGSEPLFVDEKTILETTSANTLAVIDGTVLCPPRDRTLNGISMKVVEMLCSQLRIDFAEAFIPMPSLIHATEILLTNTSFCIAGVSRIGNRAIPFPGPMLATLTAAWSQLVGQDIRTGSFPADFLRPGGRGA